MGDEDEDKGEDKDEDEKMRHTVSESYSPPALAVPALEVMDSEIRRAVECDIKMEITSLELDEALCVTFDLPARPHADLLEKELVMEKLEDEDGHVMFGMWTNSIFQ
ncbi:hypothetical protein KOW79_015493 [Hemibagrus wyckioides]|uniref:Uncharacterized protein n=1 Tax=Hemibagrus wyckioides TaxID=337641 RepID=A0A9D3SIW0_9TELE|nr:hypothetical protein KOW79_015493 [Hemibagrus wyckioides]